MLKRLAACIPLVGVCLALPAASDADSVVRPSSVRASTTVPAGGETDLTLRCPAGAVALNAALTRQGAGVSLARSIPGRGARAWRFRLQGSGDGLRASAVLRCVRLQLPAAVSRVELSVRTRRRPGLLIPAGSSTAVQLRCGGGWAGTGYGITHQGPSTVRIAAAVPTAHGWNFRLENTGTQTAGAGLSVRCLRRVVSGRRAGRHTTLGFRVARRAYSNQVGSGSESFSNRCSRSQFSLATGSMLEADDSVELSRSNPLGPRAGRWTFRGASAGTPVRTFLVCLGLRTRFR